MNLVKDLKDDEDRMLSNGMQKIYEIADEVVDLVEAMPRLEEGERPEALYQEKYESYYQEFMQIVDTLVNDPRAGEVGPEDIDSMMAKPDSEWWLD